MVGYAARQSTYVDGDVIDAADSNDEFDAILAAFGSASGHNHDGTGGEGARITVVGTSDDNVTFGSALTPDANNTIDIGTSGAQFKDIYIDGTAYLDAIDFNGTAISSTAAELNIVDGSTAATSTTLADADRVVVNDNGTMVQVALTDFETYFESALDTLSNVTTVGALNAGSITSGFGAIDNGSSAITTTGTVTYGNLSDGSITITAFVDEDDMSSNSATLVPTQQSVKAYVDTQITAEDLDITTDSGTIAIDLDSETLTVAGGTGLDSSATSNTVTLAIDSTVATLTGSQTLTNKTLTSPDINGGTVDGATIATSDITVGSGKTLDVSAGTLTLANDQISGDKVEGGTIAATTITTLTFGSITDGSITVTAFVDEDDMSSNSATLVPTQQSVKAYVDTQLTAEDLDITTDSGTIAIDLDSETLTVSGGTGIDSSATGNAVTVAIDSTVATLTGSQTLTNKTLTTPTLTTPVVNAGLQLKNGSTSAGFLEFFEDSDNGTNKATLIGPASTADVTLTLPSTTGTLATDADITALAIALG
tara:strand:+ start:2671 stop:4287 length:1617 start_codon:yes stop_codon:yes gene_type:complete